MALNLAKYRDLLNLNKLRQVKEPSADVLLHYGRLQAMRSVSDTVFGEFGEKGADVFGEKEFKFLVKIALPLSLDPSALGIKLSQSLHTCLRGIRIGDDKSGTPSCLYVGNVAGCGAGKSRLGSSVVGPMQAAAKAIWGDLPQAAANRRSEGSDQRTTSQAGHSASLVFASFTDKGCAKCLERNEVKSPEFNVDEGE